jgi:DNA modification methylase
MAGQIGLEQSPDEYIANMIAVSRELWRVLRDDGTWWLNLGDSFASDTKGTGGTEKVGLNGGNAWMKKAQVTAPRKICHGLKPKDLMMIPARVALALQAAGWYLRAEIVWAKPNPMPESMTDRPTRSHEMIYLLTKKSRYYYDAEAVKENSVDSESYNGRRKRNAGTMNDHDPDNYKMGGSIQDDGTLRYGQIYPTRNQRDVWTLPTEPYSGAHYATFPTEIPRRAILAGSKAGDVILDPFCGSGTVGEVCRELGRRFIGLDLSMKYLRENALPRAERTQTAESIATLPLFSGNGNEPLGEI